MLWTRDKKEVVFICDCGRTKSRKTWFFPTTKQMEGLKADDGKMIKLVKSVCPTCIKN